MARLIALVLATLGLSLSGGPAQAVSPVSEHTAASYWYDSPHHDSTSSATAPERGPPAPSTRHTTYDAVDRWSRGPSARSGASALQPTTTYDDLSTFVRVARGTGATERQVEISDRRFVVVDRGRVAANAAENLAEACRTNSFTGDTLVLMADGTKKPIKDVKIDDWVMATDPVTGERESRKVIDLIRHGGLHTMVAIRLADGTTIDATDRHPFWVVAENEWVNAIDLQVGDEVLTSDGRRVAVAETTVRTEILMAFNLTVEGLHTYFVGAESVLVHNCIRNSPLGWIYPPRSRESRSTRTASLTSQPGDTLTCPTFGSSSPVPLEGLQARQRGRWLGADAHR